MNLSPRIIPCLLIEDGNLVKTIKFKSPIYLGDPINAVKIFNEQEADELCLIDISSHKNNSINFELLADIASEAFMPLAYGGGISSLEDAKKLFRMGFEKVLLNTALYNNPEIVRQIVDYAGSQSVVASIDIKRNFLGKQFCYVNCGKQKINQSILGYLKYVESLGVGEIFVNSIDNDGLMKGYETSILKEISENTTLPVIACGGAGKLEDFSKVISESKVSAVAAGSIFVFYGPRKAVLINYPKEQDRLSIGLL